MKSTFASHVRSGAPSDLSEIVRIRTKGRADELVVHGMIVE